VPLEECKQLWAANQSVDHHDVGLPHCWHLNRARVSVRRHRRRVRSWMQRYYDAS
jgi:hypothetical protein